MNATVQYSSSLFLHELGVFGVLVYMDLNTPLAKPSAMEPLQPPVPPPVSTDFPFDLDLR